MNPYLIFYNEKRQGLKNESPELTYRQIAIILGQVWQALTRDEKLKYEKLAMKDVERYK